MTPTFSAYKRQGKLIITNRAVFDKYVSTLPETGIVVTVERQRRKKSRPQENFRWGVMYPIILAALKETGYTDWQTKEDIHESMRIKFLKKESDGEEIGIQKYKSTTELSTLEEDAFQESIRAWAAEYLNVEIPMPNEQLEAEL